MSAAFKCTRCDILVDPEHVPGTAVLRMEKVLDGARAASSSYVLCSSCTAVIEATLEQFHQRKVG